MLTGIFIILLFQLIGEVVQQYLSLVIPGPVIGLVLLLVCLLVSQPIKANLFSGIRQSVVSSAEGLLSYLSLLFVPIGVGVVMHLQVLEDSLLQVVGIIIVGTVTTLLFTAVLFERLRGKGGDE